jgi:transcriptional regulator with XRE-family HTH domain
MTGPSTPHADGGAGSPDEQAARLGLRLRELRARRLETLADVAARSGLTKGFLSKLERGQTSVSVGGLLRLCQALDVELGELMTAPSGRLVRVADLQRVELGGEGLREYLLTPSDERRVQVLQTEIAPGGGSGPDAYELPVEVEFVHVIEGELVIVLETEEIRLARGDSFTFVSVPHTFHNPGTVPARVLWVMAPAVAPLDRTARAASRAGEAGA